MTRELAECWDRRAGGPEMRDKGSDFVQGLRMAYSQAAADLRTQMAKLPSAKLIDDAT